MDPAVADWLENAHSSRVLHVFERACNLIDARGNLCSIVVAALGNGPFTILLERDVNFLDHVNAESSIEASGKVLRVGDLHLDLAGSHTWDPHPNWPALRADREQIRAHLAALALEAFQPNLPLALMTSFASAIAHADVHESARAAAKLAGLGGGITPSGDDYMMGAMHAAWILHPANVAGLLCDALVESVEARTTSLSRAWLRSAGGGEAAEPWHNFFSALSVGHADQIAVAARHILAVGATSGTDAFSGFASVMLRQNQSVEQEIK